MERREPEDGYKRARGRIKESQRMDRREPEDGEKRARRWI